VSNEPEQPESGDSPQRFAERFAQQWAAARAERRPEPIPIRSGTTNVARAEVPHGIDLAAAWSWRLLVIAAAGYLVLRLLAFFSVIAVPVAIALLVSALVTPLVTRLERARMPRGLAAGVVVLGGLTIVAMLLTFVGSQVASGAADLADSVVEGIGRIRSWLKTGPLDASDSQINDALGALQEAITSSTAEEGVVTRTVEVGTALGHVVAGLFIVLFATYFFLADGARIWAWLVRIAPRAARQSVDSSGHVAWRSLTQFVRATVLVAAVDAIGVMIVAAVLQVPFVLAIGVLVFLGAFIPMVGATVAGSIAVLVALVDQGPLTALLMLGGVVLVQQIEGHVLQPFLMGRFVSVHPLGVILAIGCGVIVAGIVGALVAVPLAAALNSVAQHLASHTDVGEDDPEEELEDDLEGEPGDRPADA
jgi:predicted PurR-regulated permease PerM